MSAGSRTLRHSRRSRLASRRRPLRLEALEDRSLLAPMADIENVTPDPRNLPVGLVVIHFVDESTGLPTAVTGVDASDFTLTRNTINVPLADAPVSGSGDTWAIDLASYTTVDGNYLLTLKAFESDIQDSSNQLLSSNAIESWTIDSTGLTANIDDISPDPRTEPVGNVVIKFSEAVTGVDIADFRLTRNGSAVDLAGVIVTGTADSYTINLLNVTSADGTYVLTVVASGSGIGNALGNVFTTDASDTWVNDAAAPTARFDEITPDPRNTAVSSATINFTREVTGVNTADFTLTRNGTNVSLAGVTVSGSGSSYTLNNLTTATTALGTYVLTLVASGSGITDSSGLALATNATDTWVNEVTLPTADIVDVTPDPRTTAVGLVTIIFSEAVTGVNATDFTLVRNGVSISLAGVPLSGSGASYQLNLSTVTNSEGSYVLTLVAAGSGITDSAGNAMVLNASDSFSIDDGAENNDTLRSATELGRLSGSNTFGPLSLIDQNDWYRFTTSMKGTAASSVSISFSNAAGNLDLQLYSVSGQVLKSSTGSGNRETISLNGRPAGTYYIRVYGKAGAINPEYTLTVNAPRVPVDDQFEQNDTRGTASNLGTMVSAATISNLALLDAHDWYRFSTTTAGTAGNSVGISFLNSKGNLNLELYNSAGTKIGSSNGSGNSELISLAGRAAGTYYVHVLGRSGAHNANYSLTINPPSTAAFNFQFQFEGMKASQIAAFEQAAHKWQTIIVEDVPSAIYTPVGGPSVIVDDLLIDVAAFSIDGEGSILGGAAPDAFRAGSFLPSHGTILFDSADLPSLQAEGNLLSAAVHEIAHVLGFGTIWTDKGLLAGAGTADPQFKGAQAIAAYNALFGTSATGVPLDNSGIEETADSHWSESVFDNESMTGFLNSGVTSAMSQITIAAMADLGYVVNLTAADLYAKPSASLLAANQAGNSSQSVMHLSSAAAIDALMANWKAMKSGTKWWSL